MSVEKGGIRQERRRKKNRSRWKCVSEGLKDGGRMEGWKGDAHSRKE